MADESSTPRYLIGMVLHDLASDAEHVTLIADGLEDRVSATASNAHPQKLREMATLVKAAALQLGMAAANIVGSAERLRLVAEFAEVDNEGAGNCRLDCRTWLVACRWYGGARAVAYLWLHLQAAPTTQESCP